MPKVGGFALIERRSNRNVVKMCVYVDSMSSSQKPNY